MKTQDPEPGLYKTRIRRGGPWAPVRVWWEDGERDELGHLMSDQILRGEWAPLTNQERWFPINVWTQWDFLWPIEKEEFEWLIVLKTL